MADLTLPISLPEKAQVYIGSSCNKCLVSRLVSSCGGSFKIIMFPIGWVSDSFSSKHTQPFWGKKVTWTSRVSRKSLSVELGQIWVIKICVAP